MLIQTFIVPQHRFVDQGVIFVLWLGISVIAWNLFALPDNVLVGMRAPQWVVIENTIFSGAKVVLLGELRFVIPAYGVFVSWTIPPLISLIPVNWLIFRR